MGKTVKKAHLWPFRSFDFSDINTSDNNLLKEVQKVIHFSAETSCVVTNGF